jgi:MOSC domain-containing protein YiiM
VAGSIESIHIAGREGDPVRSVQAADVVAGRGIVGDRYPFDGERPPLPGESLTLIEAEAIEAVLAEHGIDLRDGRSRRQITTRGIALNDLVGTEFRVGALRCVGVELCEPCAPLEDMTEKGVIKALVHRGGLRADVMDGGRIAVGDPVGA